MQEGIKRITDSDLKEMDIWLWCYSPNLIDKLDKLGLSVIRTGDLVTMNNILIELEDDLK